MKIGLIIDDHMGRPGGVQEYVRGLYGYLERRGHQAVIFAGGSAGAGEQRTIALGKSLAFRGSGSSTSVPLTLHSPARLRALLDEERCDILHVMAPYSPTLSGRLLTAQPAGRRAAHAMTVLVALEPPPWAAVLGTAAQLQWRSRRRFDAGIAISPSAAATGRALYGGEYTVIPPGVDVAAFHPGQPPLAALRDARLNLLYVGRLEQRKGVRHLLEALALLQPQFNYLRLIIAGDGPERAALEGQRRALGLGSVEFLGYVPAATLPRLLASADLFCAPATRAESFGIVLIEAMAAGLPVVAAGNPGYRDLLAQHAGNVVVPPGDGRALAGAISALLLAPQHRAAVGLRNRAAAQRYSWDTVGDEIMAVYERIAR